MSLLINLAIPVVPCLIIYLIWGAAMWPLMIPGLVQLLVQIAAFGVREDFHLLPSSLAKGESAIYLHLGFVGVLAALYLWCLISQDMGWKAIAGSQVLQAYTWFSFWFVSLSLLIGKK